MHKKRNINPIEEDSRFAHVAKDPRYFKTSHKKHKIQPDDRFSAMLTDDRFIEKSTMDPRGRPRSFSTRDDLKRLYNLSSDEEEETVKQMLPSKVKEEEKDSSNVKKHDPGMDYARGIATFSDDSSDDDSSTSEEEEEEDEEFEWGELDRDALWETNDVQIEETKRIAVCNMDWDKIKAVDLMAVLSSFAPQGGRISRVTIYLSDFGKERLDIELRQGPQELIAMPSLDTSDADTELKDLERIQKGKLKSDSSSQQTEALRRYQRNRLKYYYAVIECDSTETGMRIYKECDRMPFENTGGILDLRYIPDDMEFDSERVKDICTVLPQSYENPIFQTSVLLDSKPTLTWDETDSRRKNVFNNVMSNALNKKDFNEELIKDYVASGSGSEYDDDDDISYESDEQERINKFRSLINSLNKKDQCDDIIDKEMTFDSDGSEEGTEEDGGIRNHDDEDDNTAKRLTPFERFLEKKQMKSKERKLSKKEKKIAIQSQEKETSLTKKKRRRQYSSDGSNEANSNDINDKADLELLLMEEEKDDRQHFSMRKIVQQSKQLEKREKKVKKNKKFIQKKIEEKKTSKTDDFEIDVEDPRFAPLITSGDFSLDPSHPNFKSTDSMQSLFNSIQSKQRANIHERVPGLESSTSLTKLAKKVERKLKR